MRMESPDDYTRWIERAARPLEEAQRNEDVKQALAEMKLNERAPKVRRTYRQHEMTQQATLASFGLS